MPQQGVISVLEFSRLPREDKEIKFRQLKIVTKYIFPSKQLERDIKDNIKNLTDPMLNKFYAQMLTRI